MKIYHSPLYKLPSDVWTGVTEWQCVFCRMRQTREIDFSLFAHEVAKHVEQKLYGWKNDLNLLLK